MEPSSIPTAGPTASPSESHSFLPTDGPSLTPSLSPTEAHSFLPSDGPSLTPSLTPTATPTASPTESHSALPSDGPSLTPSMMIVTEPPIITNGEDDDKVPTFLPPMENDCPEDIILIDHIGVTPYQEDSVVILSQDTTSVTVALQQMYTSPEENVPGRNTIEITIECSRNSQIALLEYWVADDLRKGVLQEGDNAEIPECCHPDVPEETPVTKYY